MADLITVPDVEARIGRAIEDVDELARIEALIADASATVRAYCGRPFAATSKTKRFRVRCGVIDLGRDDVTDVTDVAMIDGTAIDGTWDGGRLVAVGSVNRWDIESLGLTYADVSYEYGDDTVPADVKAVCAQVVARAFGKPADETALQSENVEGYSYSVGAAAAAGPAGLLADEKAVLDRYRPAVGLAWLA